jgi:hypothetical protein
MNLLSPNLAMAYGASVVVNSLYDSTDPGFLTEDLMLVQLPGKTYIDVSWFPEHDPAGAYIVTVFRDHRTIREVEVTTARAAIEAVENLAIEFGRPVGKVSCSSERTETFNFQPVA